MADAVFERHLQNVTNRIKKRKYEESEYNKPKAAKINAEDDLKILDRDLLVTEDDFSCFTDDHRRDELDFSDAHYVTIDEWNDTSKSKESSPVPTKVIKLDHDLENKTQTSSPTSTKVIKLGHDLDNKTSTSSPVSTKVVKLGLDIDGKMLTSSPIPNKVTTLGHENDIEDKTSTSASVLTENDKHDNFEENVPSSNTSQLETTQFHLTPSTEYEKHSSSLKKRAHAQPSLLNKENLLKSEASSENTTENINMSCSVSVNYASITSRKVKQEPGMNQSTDKAEPTSNVIPATHTATKPTPKTEPQINIQTPSKYSENVPPVVPLTKVEAESAKVCLSTLKKDEESSEDILAKNARVPLTEKVHDNVSQSYTSQTDETGAISILEGLPVNVEVNDLLVMVMSGDSKIRTVQRVTPSLKVPQLFVSVISCVSNSPLKVIVMGLQRCENMNRGFFKVTAVGQTEIEKGKKTDKIMLSEVTGTEGSISSLFSTDKFPNIKHAATNNTPESNYDIYIQNLILTHLDNKSRFILLQNAKTGVIYLFIEEYRSRIDVKFVFPFPLRPCTPYKIMIWLADRHADKTLQAFCKIKDTSDEGYIESDNIQIITAVMNLQTYMTKFELRKLADLATTHVVTGSYNQYAYLHCFYRNKPEHYYQSIYNRDNGIMLPYMKDQNGDPSSVINGKIKGLFFSSVLDRNTLKPMSFSYFGSRRIYILANLMFHDDSNLYFADFYCHYDVHYVTVVLTEPGSATDQFCRERLLLLNKYNNPFIKLVNINGESKVYVTLGVHVEVFYTEPVDLYFVFNRQMGFLFEDTPTRGRGCSIPKIGIPKRSDCKICNL